MWLPRWNASVSMGDANKDDNGYSYQNQRIDNNSDDGSKGDSYTDLTDNSDGNNDQCQAVLWNHQLLSSSTAS